MIVIGAGPGGSAAAALLAKAGKRVLLVDKNPSAGGRMRTIHDAEGFHYELFPINGCPANGSRMDEVLEKIGKADAVKRIDPRQLGLPISFISKMQRGTAQRRYDEDGPFHASLYAHFSAQCAGDFAHAPVR